MMRRLKTMIKHGSTRMVFLVGGFAIKIPALVEWRLFLHGLLGNLQEACWYSQTKRPELCPVLWAGPGGFVLVMRRAQPCPLDVFNDLNVPQWRDSEDCVIPVEDKLDSFGVLDGKIVAVDYGS